MLNMGQIRKLFAPRSSNRLRFTNETDSILEIFIEPTPDRYILRTGDRLIIEAALGGASFDVTAHKGGVTIYAGNDGDPFVSINGRQVETDWETPLNSNWPTANPSSA